FFAMIFSYHLAAAHAWPLIQSFPAPVIRQYRPEGESREPNLKASSAIQHPPRQCKKQGNILERDCGHSRILLQEISWEMLRHEKDLCSAGDLRPADGRRMPCSDE